MSKTKKEATAEEEYEKNLVLRREDVKELLEWSKTQPKFPPLKELEMIMFYHSCYYDKNATMACAKTFFKLLHSTPEFFLNRNISRPELQRALKCLYYSCLPVKDPNGYQIIFHSLREFEARKYVFNDGVKLLAMAVNACLHTEGTVPGYIFLFSMSGVRFTHLLRLSVTYLSRFFVFIQEGIPIILKAIHVVNTSSIVDKIMFLIKPFIKKELLNMIHFHSSNYEEVQQYLPKNCLPSDFGGDLPSIEELHENFIEWMTELTPMFLEEEKRLNKEPSEEPEETFHEPPSFD